MQKMKQKNVIFQLSKFDEKTTFFMFKIEILNIKYNKRFKYK